MSRFTNLTHSFFQNDQPVSQPAIISSQLIDFEQSELQRKTRLLKVLCQLMVVALIIGAVAFVGFAVVIQQPLQYLGAVVSLAGAGLSLWATQLANQGKYSMACWSVISSVIAVIVYSYWLTGTAVVLVLVSLLPIALAISLMSNRQVLLLSGLLIVYNSLWYIGEHYLKALTPLITLTDAIETADNLFLILVVIPLLILILIIPARNQVAAMRAQNQHLKEALLELENRQRTSQTVSQQVLSLTNQLTSTATQQASGSQQQAAVVSQVGTSVNELSTTAGQIAELAVGINQAAELAAMDSTIIEQTTANSLNHSQSGLVAVERTLEASQQVSQVYQTLVGTLDDLNLKHKNMNIVLKLLNDLSNETHLLSLNATIEAAGAGQYGERFGVVAQEVKHLANRSANANREAVTIVREIGAAVEAAHLAVTEGFSKAGQMQVEAHQTGLVISELETITNQCHLQARKVSQAIQQVSRLADTISSATSQQHTANRQVQEILQGLDTVAGQNAEGSRFISSAVVELEGLSNHLSNSLSLSVL